MRNFWQLVVATCMLLTFGAKADVILHAFNWKYSEVTRKADEIKNAGYKEVLISPPSNPLVMPGGVATSPRTTGSLIIPWAINRISRH
ncbi:hypothetical protein [Dongshaea marina]|uniref:hypothetical protein n=1 Tax=Dongshaea marina TaxID=2047966 RepID=UPI001F41D4D1|nr:hypothetical protein [Dongshaea marina]